MARFKKHILKRVFNFFAREGDSANFQMITEKPFRKLTAAATHQYDIFHMPGNEQHNWSVFNGVLYFVDMLYGFLNDGSDFKQIFYECERVCSILSWLEKEDITQLSRWIGKVTSCHITWYQSAFICTLLGQLAKVTCRADIFIAIHSVTADKLLEYLTDCKYDIILQSSVEHIKSVAIDLFKVSSDNGWLAFLSYFANLLDVESLLRSAERLPKTYSEETFNTLIGYLVALLMSVKEVDDGIKILEFVIDRCLSINCLWHLYQELSAYLPHFTDGLAERFSKQFCQLICSRTRSQKVDLLQHNVWENTPRELSVKLAGPFVEALQHQIAHETVLSAEKRIILKTYTSQRDICSSKHFASFILSLANNKSESVLFTLVEMLDSNAFCVTWRLLRVSERAGICKCLLKNMLRSHSRNNVVQVLKAAKIIGETYALQCDPEILSVLEKCAVEKLQNVSIQTILAAYVDLEQSSQIVESCYSSLLRDAVKRKSMTSGDNASLIKMLLFYLDIKGRENQTEPLQG